jgi:hypothetical protein
VCKSYQSNWKNRVQYIAGISALLALTASAIVWMIGNGRAFVWPREDVRILSLNTMRAAVVANFGDREIYLSHIMLFMKGRTSSWIAPTLHFDSVLEPGKIIRQEFPETKKQSKQVVRGMPNEVFEKLIVRAVEADPCVDLAFFVEDDPSLREIRRMAGSTLNSFDVEGYLQYWVVSDHKAKSLGVKGTGIALVCQNQG